MVPLVAGISPIASAAAAPAAEGTGTLSATDSAALPLEGLRAGRPDGVCLDLFELADHSGTCTHGPDVTPAADASDAQGGRGTPTDGTTAAAGEELPRSPATATTALPCVGDGVSGNRVEMLYLRASDVANRFTTYARTLQNYANDVDAAFVRSAQRSGGPDVHVRFLTSADCRPVLRNVTVSPTGDNTFNDTITELKALGYNRTDRTYLIWADASVYCGIATMKLDDRATSSNANNSGPSYSRVDNRCWNGPTAAHELAHNFGAVQRSAPHATAGGHCTDSHDLMCYSDAAGVTMSYVCAESSYFLFDCRHDDYFSAKSQPGGYLANHWNMARNCRLTLVWCGSDNTVRPMPADTTPPSAPTKLVLTPTTQTSLALTWDPADDNVGVAGYRVKRDGGAYTWYWIGTTTMTDTGLRPGVTYSYTVEAYDASGNVSAASAPVSGQTAPDRTAPSTPSAVAASAATDSSVRLSWQPSTDDIGVTGYRVYRDGVAKGTTATTGFDDNTVRAGNTYAYAVTAFDRAGNESAASSPLRVTVSLAPPTNLSSPAQTSSSITLTWQAATSNAAVAGYRVYRNGVLVQTTSSTTATDDGLVAARWYQYTVRAFDSAGNVSADSPALTVRTKVLCTTILCL